MENLDTHLMRCLAFAQSGHSSLELGDVSLLLNLAGVQLFKQLFLFVTLRI
jgi:hypothetical protein